jgi:hypothetical protein
MEKQLKKVDSTIDQNNTCVPIIIDETDETLHFNPVTKINTTSAEGFGTNINSSSPKNTTEDSKDLSPKRTKSASRFFGASIKKAKEASAKENLSNTILFSVEEEDTGTKEIWNNNGGTNDNIDSHNIQINVSAKGKDDKRLFDVYVSLTNMPEERLLIDITRKQTMSGFFRTVRESLESKYAHLNGLKRLRIKEMKAPIIKRDLPNDQNQGKNYFQLYESEEDNCYMSLYSNAHVLVELESQDLWLSCVLHLHSPDFKNFQSTFEIKVDMSLTGTDLKNHI